MSVPKAGALAKASDWTTVFPLDTDAWTAYVPTLVQSGTVTKTVSIANYTRVGRIIFGQVRLAVTGAGTASNEVRIGLPVTAASSGALTLGSGFIIDTSAAALYKGVPLLSATTYVTLLSTSGTSPNSLGADTFTAALAAGDSVAVSFAYEAAS